MKSIELTDKERGLLAEALDKLPMKSIRKAGFDDKSYGKLFDKLEGTAPGTWEVEFRNTITVRAYDEESAVNIAEDIAAQQGIPIEEFTIYIDGEEVSQW